MSKLDVINDLTRDDIRWFHPLTHDHYPSVGMHEIPHIEELFDESVPFEERRVIYQQAKEELAGPDPKWFEPIENDNTTKYVVPGCPEEPETSMSVSVMRPNGFDETKTYPVIFYIAGGGLLFNMVFADYVQPHADAHNAIVVIPYYRTTFDDNGFYPAALNDLHAAYAWMVDNAEELRIDPDRVALYGESSGGHMALALPHRLMRYGYRPRGTMACEPIVDDRLIWPSSVIDTPSWTARELYITSRGWLNGCDPVPAEAFPNRAEAEECVGLCPTAIATFELEPSVSPVLAYATKLMQAGVFTNLFIMGGVDHSGIQMEVPELNERYEGFVRASLNDFLTYDLRRSWLLGE